MENIRFLTIAEVAEMLKVHEASVRRLVWRRSLPSVRVGRVVRIPASAVEALVALATERPGSRLPARGR